jgi:hypothetical protein
MRPMTPHAFGTEPPRDKQKIGGNVYYLNCSLAEAYDRPLLKVVMA